MSRKYFFEQKPYAFLLITFAIVGFLGDVLYPIVSEMETRRLFVSPGEILRGGALFILLIMLIMGKLKLPPKWLVCSLASFVLVAILYAGLGEQVSFHRGEMRIFFIIKVTFLVLMISLVYEVLNRGELSVNTLVKYLVGWVLVFHVIPIIMSYYKIFGYQSYTVAYRVGYKGLIHAQNTASVILLSTFPFMAIPKTVLACFVAIAGFLACELLGTKAAAVGGFLIPLFLLFFGIFSRKLKVRTVVLLSVVSLGIFLFKDAILSIQLSNLELFRRWYIERQNLLWVLISGRSIYYSELPEFFQQNNILELLVGSPMLRFNELDHLAMLSRFGIFGLALYLIVFIWGVKICFFFMRKGWLEVKLAVALLAILVHSFMGGHVIANAVSAFPVAVVIGTAIYLTKTKNKRRSEGCCVDAVFPHLRRGT